MLNGVILFNHILLIIGEYIKNMNHGEKYEPGKIYLPYLLNYYMDGCIYFY